MSTRNWGEQIAKRRTYDNIVVRAYESGTLIVGFERYARSLTGEALWLFLGEVELYERDEIPRAIKMARAAVAQSIAPSLEYFRRRMNGYRLKRGKKDRVYQWVKPV